MVRISFPNRAPTEKVLAVAEFVSEEKQFISNGSVIALSVLNKHDLVEEKEEDKLYFDGLLCQDSAPYSAGKNNVVYEFNRNLKGWHYGYLGSKKTRDSYHSFRVYCVEVVPGMLKSGEQMYKVLCSTESPKWQMYCRRRKHPNAVVKPQRVNLEQFLDGEHQKPQLNVVKPERNSLMYMPNSSTMKRRPDPISSHNNRLAVRRKSNPCPDLLNLSISSGHSFDLPTPKGMFGDSSPPDLRYDKLLDAVDYLKLQTPLQVRNISISKRMVDPFADKVYAFLSFWNSYKRTTPRVPSKVFQLGPSRATEIERFAGFIIQQSQFQHAVMDFLNNDNPLNRPKDSMQLSVFMLGQITAFFKPFIDSEKWQSHWKTEQPQNNSLIVDTECHVSNPSDFCSTPRSLNLDDFDLMRHSLITPRSASSFSFPKKIDIGSSSSLFCSSLPSPPYLHIPSPADVTKKELSKPTEITGIGGSFYLGKNLPSPLKSPGFMQDIDKFVNDTSYLDPNDSWINSPNGNLKMSPSSRLVNQFFA